ncbi:PadR family transcriptional regulator [Streptomyces monashensis]|uniref:PadR family transcriptional regulator n=1 Tax=Streptomyces monashensis TaxID=1678012 RepID=UPI003CCB8B5F
MDSAARICHSSSCQACWTLSILGFLCEVPLHGYELRTRIARPTGHARAVSHGTLYPAIKRTVSSRAQGRPRTRTGRRPIS